MSERGGAIAPVLDQFRCGCGARRDVDDADATDRHPHNTTDEDELQAHRSAAPRAGIKISESARATIMT